MSKINILKASGETEPFSDNKVRNSLKRAGASQAVIDQVMLGLIGRIREGMTTRSIYKQVFELFNQYQSKSGFRYGLKQSLMALGPSGYPFEKFIGKLLAHLGYQTQTNVTIQGKCISHEVDVVGVKDNFKFLVECKFHNHPGVKTRSKDALYTQARFEDIQAVSDYQQVWLVTNTKLTQNAIAYGLCRGMKLIAWGYPQKNSLEQLIEANQFYPATCLSFLKPQEIYNLIREDLILYHDLIKTPEKDLKRIGLSSDSISRLRFISVS